MRWYAGLSLIVGGLLVVWLSARSESVAARPVVKLAAARVAATAVHSGLDHYTGAGSCMAAACHGFQVPTDGKIWNSSGTIWLTKDPHSEAYNVLFNQQSKRIVAALYPEKDPKDIQPQFEARCVGCHAGVDTNEPRKVPHLLSDGVSCEACHGPAKNWIARHTEYGFDRASAHGDMVDTRDLKVRAEQCVKCHIGSAPSADGVPARDMNHDMIAAGHPALKFEFAAYLANMPRHWNPKTPPAVPGSPQVLSRDLDRPDFEARAWAIGQFVSAKADLELLAYRAQTANSADKAHSSPWPEFSAYDCFACHHDLQKDSFRRSNRREGAPLGAYTWGEWYFPMCEVLNQGQIKDGQNDSIGSLRALVVQPRPAPAEVEKSAAALASQLESLAADQARKTFDQAETSRLVGEISKRTVYSWDEAVQIYLALAALQAPQKTAEPSLAALRKTLAFPLGDERSPRYNSPRTFDPAEVQRVLDQLPRN